MILFPAIDLKDGKCVRLVQGDFNKSTTYNNSPLDLNSDQIPKALEKEYLPHPIL